MVLEKVLPYDRDVQGLPTFPSQPHVHRCVCGGILAGDQNPCRRYLSNVTEEDVELQMGRQRSPRSASGIVVVPERRKSSLVRTATAAAASARVSRVRETEVTSVSDSSSRVNSVRSRGRGGVCSAAETPATSSPPMK